MLARLPPDPAHWPSPASHIILSLEDLTLEPGVAAAAGECLFQLGCVLQQIACVVPGTRVRTWHPALAWGRCHAHCTRAFGLGSLAAGALWVPLVYKPTIAVPVSHCGTFPRARAGGHSHVFVMHALMEELVGRLEVGVLGGLGRSVSRCLLAGCRLAVCALRSGAGPVRAWV